MSAADVWKTVLGILGFLGVIAGIAFGAENVAFQIRAGRWASEIEQIDKQLDELYGPLQRLLETNRLLHVILKSEQPDAEDFRTLDKLLGDHPFSENDKSLIAEIIEIDKQLLKLIDSDGGFVEGTITISAATDTTLAKLGVELGDIIADTPPKPGVLNSKGPVRVDMSKILAKACRHFRIICLAHDKKLNDEVDRFHGFVYPRALNLAVNAEVERLKARQAYLREQIDRGPRHHAGDR